MMTRGFGALTGGTIGFVVAACIGGGALVDSAALIVGEGIGGAGREGTTAAGGVTTTAGGGAATGGFGGMTTAAGGRDAATVSGVTNLGAGASGAGFGGTTAGGTLGATGTAAAAGLLTIGGGAAGFGSRCEGGWAIASFCCMARRTSPGREICDRSIFVLISSSPRTCREVLAGADSSA